MNALNDFVPAGYPLPWNPITLAEFVPGGFPLPQNPVYFASAGGALPKAPGIPMAAIGARNGKAAIAAAAASGCGDCGCGGSCGGCGGMGTLSSDTFIPQASLPAFLQGDAYITGFPTVYLAGAVALTLVLMMSMGGRSARRRR
jgi:hypothetical protein